MSEMIRDIVRVLYILLLFGIKSMTLVFLFYFWLITNLVR